MENLRKFNATAKHKESANMKIYCDCGTAESYNIAAENGWRIDISKPPFTRYVCTLCAERKG